MQTLVNQTPATLPVDLDVARAFLKVDTEDEDDIITQFILTSAETFEGFAGRPLVTRTVTETHDTVPTCEVFKPAVANLQTVTSISVHTSGSIQVVPTDSYSVDVPGCRIIFTASLPTADTDYNAFKIIYTAGFGATPDDIPAGIKQGVLHHIADMFENREGGSEPTDKVKALWQRWRRMAL